MAAQQTSPRSLKSIAGAILLALGFLILFANLDGVTRQITSVVGTSPEPAQGILPALVLATWHVLQEYAFDPAGFLSGLLQILLSFWPLILSAGLIRNHRAAVCIRGPTREELG